MMTIRLAAATGLLLAAVTLTACAPNRPAHTYQAPTASAAVPQSSTPSTPAPTFPAAKVVPPVKHAVVKKPAPRPVPVVSRSTDASVPPQNSQAPAPAYTAPAPVRTPTHAAPPPPAPVHTYTYTPPPQPAANRYVTSAVRVSCYMSGGSYVKTYHFTYSDGSSFGGTMTGGPDVFYTDRYGPTTLNFVGFDRCS